MKNPERNKEWSYRFAALADARAKKIIIEVALINGLSVEDLMRDIRTRRVSTARQEAILRLRAERDEFGESAYTYREIGDLFGYKDHTTPMYAAKRAEAKLAKARGRAGEKALSH